MWRSKRLWQSSQQRMFSSSRFLIDPQVQKALTNGEPVVALESTIVSHGMPYPQNLELAQEVESILREKVRVVRSKSAFSLWLDSRLILYNLQGVTPATIAIQDGVCLVGLTFEELVDFAKQVRKGVLPSAPHVNYP